MIKNKQDIYRDLFLLKDYCKEFLKHPVEKIKSVPVVSWESTVAGIFGINIICGILRAFYQFSFINFYHFNITNLINFVIALFITPIIAALILILLSLFIYYFFQILFKETYNFEKICTILFLSYVPGAPLYLGSVFYPPLFILGAVINAILLVVGLEENLRVPKKTLIKIVGIGFFLALVFWMTNQIYGLQTNWEPKSLDQLEEETMEN